MRLSKLQAEWGPSGSVKARASLIENQRIRLNQTSAGTVPQLETTHNTSPEPGRSRNLNWEEFQVGVPFLAAASLLCVVEDLIAEEVASTKEVMEVLKKASKNLRAGAPLINANSS